MGPAKAGHYMAWVRLKPDTTDEMSPVRLKVDATYDIWGSVGARC